MTGHFALQRPVASLAWGFGFLLTFGVACSDPEPKPSSDVAFWPLDFETSYSMVRDCRLSPAEHDGYYIQVFADPASAAAYTDGTYPFEPGAKFVKGEYSDETCSQLERASGMRKLTGGSDAELGDWQWQRADPDGHLLTLTPARSCAGCHKDCQTRDYTCTDP